MSEPDGRESLRRIAAAAEAFLAGRAGTIATAREIADLCGEIVPEWTDDQDYLTIGAIVDRADGLPVGEVRQFWAPEALAQRDVLIQKIEAEDRRDLEVACRNLLHRYQDI